jgi:hypothetical protein
MWAEEARERMLLAQRDIRRLGPLASITRRKKGSVFLGTTPKGQITTGFAEGGYQEQTPVTRYSEMMLSTNRV